LQYGLVKELYIVPILEKRADLLDFQLLTWVSPNAVSRRACLGFRLLVPFAALRWARKEPIMAKHCDICGKATVFGKKISHAHNVTSRTWEPNLQRVRALVEGKVRRIDVCTRCLRSGKIVKAPVRSWRPEEGAEVKS
jgi:large subunit ribosomal protein L28